MLSLVFLPARYLTLLAALGATLLSCGALAQADNDKASEQQARLDALEKAINNAQQQLAGKTTALSQIERDIAKTELTINQLAKQKRALNRELKTIAEGIEQLRQRSTALDKQISEQKQRIGDQLVEVYKRSNRSPIQLLLDTGSPADIDRQLVYLERINSARLTLLKEYKSLLEEQQNLEAQQQARQSERLAAREKLDAREAEFKQAQLTRQEQMKALNQSITTDKSRIEKMQADREALSALLEEMTAALDADESNWSGYQTPSAISGSFPEAKGRLPWPISSSQRKRERDGMSLSASKGTEVKAIYGGRIIFADWFRGQGLLIILDHGNNYWSLYGHNESLLKSAGDAVTAGETIATVGNSGGQNHDALYFEIRHKGKPQQPVQWCKN